MLCFASVLQIIEVILNAPFHATKAALPAMIDAGWGRVVNTGTCLGWVGSVVALLLALPLWLAPVKAAWSTQARCVWWGQQAAWWRCCVH